MRKPGPHPDADEGHHHDHGGDAGDVSPDRIHLGGSFAAGGGTFATPRPCRYATSASSSVLSETAFAAPAMSASVYGSPNVRSARMRAAMSPPSSAARASHGYAGMFDSWTNARGSRRCSRCHSSEYLPPTRARSGPVRFEPHWKGRS